MESDYQYRLLFLYLGALGRWRDHLPVKQEPRLWGFKSLRAHLRRWLRSLGVS